jgi:hypothetical protein
MTSYENKDFDKLKEQWGQAEMAHTCNPSYSGGRGLGGLWFEASPGKYFGRHYLKKLITKKGWWSGSSCRP